MRRRARSGGWTSRRSRSPSCTHMTGAGRSRGSMTAASVRGRRARRSSRDRGGDRARGRWRCAARRSCAFSSCRGLRASGRGVRARCVPAVAAVYAGVRVGGVALGATALERVLPRTLVRAACLWAALGGRSLAREAAAVAACVEAGALGAGRVRVRSLVGRDPDALDGSGLCAAAIESVAENTVDAVVAPLLWAAVAGAPGVAAYRAVNTLDAMVGRRDERYARFGTASARADDAANWPAARVAGALVVALAGPRAARA